MLRDLLGEVIVLGLAADVLQCLAEALLPSWGTRPMLVASVTRFGSSERPGRHNTAGW
jgi:hypothetical protein